METHELGTHYRETTGKGAARKMRLEGRIPAILYGHEEEPVSIWIDEAELRKLLVSTWETAIVDLKISGKVKKECNAIIKDIQQHPTTGKVLHVDFQFVRRGQKLRLDVPIKLTGDPRGVKEMGGVLEHGAREVSIRCMPRHIPEFIEIDVAHLGIHDSIHVKELVDRYPDIEFLDDPESTLANVLPPKVEVEKAVEEEIGEEEEPEVIAKGKEEAPEEATDKQASQ